MGPQGTPGARGPPGLKGDRGAPGDKGAKGESGVSGKAAAPDSGNPHQGMEGRVEPSSTQNGLFPGMKASLFTDGGCN